MTSGHTAGQGVPQSRLGTRRAEYDERVERSREESHQPEWKLPLLSNLLHLHPQPGHASVKV